VIRVIEIVDGRSVIRTCRSVLIRGCGGWRLLTSPRALVVATVVQASALSAQRVPTIPAAAPEKFQVASVRQNNSQDRAWRFNYQGETFTFVNAPVREIVRLAYGIGPPYSRPLAEIAGEPSWVDERYDIVAKTDGPATPIVTKTLGPVNRMLQALLADRFMLAAHWESRERPGFALERVPRARALGPNLRPTPTVDCPAYFAAERAARRAGTSRPDPIPGRNHPAPICAVRARDTEILIGAQPVQVLADTLAYVFRQAIIDETGLAGSFDIQLTFSPVEPSPSVRAKLEAITPNPPAPVPSIFDALREQLGLSLVPRPSSIDVLVIDRLQRPSEN
jgi:uncharacterized protein (TIGR03435 family)